MRFRLLCVLTAFVALAMPAVANKPRGAELTYIYLRADDTTIMSGSLDDLNRVKKGVARGERVIWLRTPSGKELVVRDAGVLDQFDTAWRAADALAQQQGEVGGRQGVIGTRQGAIGMKQGAVGMQIGALSTTLADLEAREDEAASDAQRDAIAKQRRKVEAQLQKLEKKQAVLDAQMRELEKSMRTLEKEMDAISRKHDAAAEQARIASEALLARAISTGVAKPF